tara:strand:+ start:584 stop:958 length:375 start_codon:yes stop_codon:yes gene_type:complete
MSKEQYRHVIDGKADYSDGLDKDKQKARDLEEILGVRELNPFKTANAEDFERDISDMTLNDLRTLAVKSGVFPSGNKATLKNKLRKEFKIRAMGGVNRASYDREDVFGDEVHEKLRALDSKRGE